MLSSSGEVINNQAGRGAFLVMTEAPAIKHDLGV
jgi:hypothetical protein